MKFFKHSFLTVLCLNAILLCAQDNAITIDSVGCTFEHNTCTLGIGVVMITDSLDIYNDSLLHDKAESHTLSESMTPTSNWGTLKYCPLYFKPDYSVVHFVCIGKTAKAYKVIVNYSQIKYLPRTKEYVFRAWDSYILESGGLSCSPQHDSTYVLRQAPSLNSDSVVVHDYHGIRGFCPVEVKGDWVKVIYTCPYYECGIHSSKSECGDRKTAWLKWKKKNKLLVYIDYVGD